MSQEGYQVQGHLRAACATDLVRVWNRKSFRRGTFQGLPLGPSGMLGPRASGVVSRAAESHVPPWCVGGGTGAAWGARGLLGPVHTALPPSPSQFHTSSGQGTDGWRLGLDQGRPTRRAQSPCRLHPVPCG